MLGELVTNTDPRQHQQLRAVDRAATQHHLTPRVDHPSLAKLLEFDPHGARAVENYSRGGGFAVQGQVHSLQHRFQIRVGGAPPRSPALRDTGFAKAFVAALAHGFQPSGGR